jgi:hypothetical protein
MPKRIEVLTAPPAFTPTLHQEELEWFMANAPTWGWHWAKTFAKGAHHSYVMKGKHLDAETYERAVRVVMALGQPANFHRRVNLELHLHNLEMPYGAPGEEQVLRGFKFWPMTNEMSISQAFNVAPVHLSYGAQTAVASRDELTRPDQWDFPAADLDWYLNNPEVRTLERWKGALHKALGIPSGNFVNSAIELGPSTGFAKDLGLIADNAEYRLVQGSQGLMNQAIFKHDVRDIRPMDVNEYLDPWHWEAGDTANTVLALFGAASYLSPGAVEQAFVRARSRLVLMHHLPDTGTQRDFGVRLHPEHRESLQTAENLPGARTVRAQGYAITVVRK